MENVVWAKSAGGTGLDESMSIAVDASGNTYLAGYFSSFSLNFGSTTLTSLGNEDVFLAKYDANGNVVWAKKAGGTYDDRTNSVAVDASGNSYVAGYFSSSNITFGSLTLTNAGGDDLFIAKYNTAGNVVWAKSAGSLYGDYAQSFTVDGFGDIYITGTFCTDTLIFGSTTLTSAGACDIYLAKLNNDVGINEFHKPLNISVYPIPASDKLTIDIQEINEFHKATVSFYDIQGQLLLQQTIKQSQIEINISSFAKGVYIIKVHNDNNIMVSKFIKE